MVGRVHVCISLESCGDLGACAPEWMGAVVKLCVSLAPAGALTSESESLTPAHAPYNQACPSRPQNCQHTTTNFQLKVTLNESGLLAFS